MKPVNFLEFSESYRESMGMNRKSKTDYAKVWEIIAPFLGEDYSLSKGKSCIFLFEKLKDGGIELGPESIRKFIKSFQNAVSFLKADEEGKNGMREKLSRPIDAMSVQAISSLVKDGITEWSQIEAMMAAEESRLLLSAETLERKIDDQDIGCLLALDESEPRKIEPEEYVEQEEAEAMVLGEMDFYFIADKLRAFISILPSEINRALEELEKKYKSDKGELCECLDELVKCRGGLEGVETLKMILAQERERGNKLAEENASLAKENSELKIQMEKEKLNFKNMEPSEVLRMVAEKIDSEKQKKKNSVMKAPEKKGAKNLSQISANSAHLETEKKEMPDLPKIYTPTGGEVIFEKYFLDSLNRFWMGNRSTALRIIDSINRICSNGKENVSFQIRTMEVASKNKRTPENASYLKIAGKYRVTMQIQKGGKAIFYEVFHKNNSPYNGHGKKGK